MRRRKHANFRKFPHLAADVLEETKLVGRAKIILMEKMRITEPEAHRYIEKEAMDSRRTRKEVAESIINA